MSDWGQSNGRGKCLVSSLRRRKSKNECGVGGELWQHPEGELEPVETTGEEKNLIVSEILLTSLFIYFVSKQHIP